MSTKGNMTRDQAIQAVGIALVDKLERTNCEPTGRLQTDGDDAVEFAASIPTGRNDYGYTTLRAYYYQSSDGVASADLDALPWTIAGYELS